MLSFAPVGAVAAADGDEDGDGEAGEEESPVEADQFLSHFFRQLVSSAVREAAEEEDEE